VITLWECPDCSATTQSSVQPQCWPCRKMMRLVKCCSYCHQDGDPPVTLDDGRRVCCEVAFRLENPGWKAPCESSKQKP
jgi:hypothetical protein